MPSDASALDSATAQTTLLAVGELLHLRTADARTLRRHTAHTYLLPREELVLRLAPNTPENLDRATTAVRITAWLADVNFPSVRPGHPTPIQVHPAVATLWHHLPQPEHTAPLPVAALGRLLCDLHQLPPPPFTLPTVEPLARLRRALIVDAGRQQPILTATQRRFLDDRVAALEATFAGLDFPLGAGLIHNDAHVGNLLTDPTSPYGYVLADWEPAGYGPHEIDLILEGAPGNRFGLPEPCRQEFAHAYGYDIADWPDWHLLADMRDLHSLAAYIRAAPHKPDARAELRLRLDTLRSGDRTRNWSAVP